MGSFLEFYLFYFILFFWGGGGAKIAHYTLLAPSLSFTVLCKSNANELRSLFSRNAARTFAQC